MLMTMTTCNRIAKFKETVFSIKDTFEDLALIDRVTIIDNNSPLSEVEEMRLYLRRLLPNIKTKFVFNNKREGFCHTASMNIWLDEIKNEEFCFHCEDDWYFVNPGKPLSWALDTLNDPTIGQARLRIWPSGLPITTPYWERTQENQNGRFYWPSQFTLTPTVTKVSSVLFTGKFDEVVDFEKEYGKRWTANGYKSVYHPTGFCNHMSGDSAYKDTLR